MEPSAAAGGDQSNNNDDNSNGKGKRKIETGITSSISLATLDKITKRSRKRLNPRAVCTFYDNDSPGYGWLLPGWIAEERVMESGRVYRYYYDPEGKLYSSQQDVFAAWEKTGVVMIDK